MTWVSTVGGRCRRCSWWVALCVATAVTPPALAQPSAAEKATARTLVKEGRVKLKRGDIDAALADFQAAHDIMHVPTTGFELGKTQARAGMLVEALDTLLAVNRKPAPPGEPRAFRNARGQAKKLAEQLSPRVPSVRVKLTGELAEGATVFVDGHELSPQLVGMAYKVNPGVHDVVAKNGEAVEQARVELDEGEAREVVLQLTPLPEPAAPPPVVADEPIHPLVWAGLALTVAGGVAGSVTGALALDKHAEVAPRCPEGQCPPDTHDDLDAGLTLGTASTVLFAAAGVGAVATAVGLLLPYDDGDEDGADDDPTTPDAWLRLGPGWVTVGASF